MKRILQFSMPRLDFIHSINFDPLLIVHEVARSFIASETVIIPCIAILMFMRIAKQAFRMT